MSKWEGMNNFGYLKIRLAELPPYPNELNFLFENRDSLLNIRGYNQAFAFTSFGATIPRFPGRGPPSFVIQGQVSHLIGSLLPEADSRPAYAQIYFFDTDYQSELLARGDAMDGRLDSVKLDAIQNILHDINPYIGLL